MTSGHATVIDMDADSVDVTITGSESAVMRFLSEIGRCENLVIPLEPGSRAEEMTSGRVTVRFTGQMWSATEMESLADKIRAAAAQPVG